MEYIYQVCYNNMVVFYVSFFINILRNKNVYSAYFSSELELILGKEKECYHKGSF